MRTRICPITFALRKNYRGLIGVITLIIRVNNCFLGLFGVLSNLSSKLGRTDLETRAANINVGYDEVPLAGQVGVPPDTPTGIHRLGPRPPVPEHQQHLTEGIIQVGGGVMPPRRFRQKRRQRSSLLFGARNWLSSTVLYMPHYRFSTRMIWRNGWIEERTFGGMNDSEKWKIFRSHHTKIPHFVNGCSSKNFNSNPPIHLSIQACPPNSSDDLWPSLLSDSSDSYGVAKRGLWLVSRWSS